MNSPPIGLVSDSVPLHPLPPTVSPLTAENVLWSNTVLAAGSVVGFVIYTGPETRAVMNTSHPETKVGLLDLEINNLAKVLSSSPSREFDADTTFCPRFSAPLRLCCPSSWWRSMDSEESGISMFSDF